ncbi:hypothetical protein [Mixta sp. Marseille-Q2659]|uniref:hypothetical protein n=1 Tax=Mixta sp. Marseille-Q2659 TaxID=2736607 RepID=UPI0023B963EF|nr:hypothetical protein [Mixta sp. Marseille-Q2659]
MRELNGKKIAQAGGGFSFFNNIGANIGSSIGGFVDKGTALFGLQTNATEVGSPLGTGIGKLLGLDIGGAIKDIGNGIVGIVQFGLGALQQVTNKKIPEQNFLKPLSLKVN